jgi:hypothetical protein
MGRQDQGVEAEKEVHRPIQDLPAHVFGLEKEKDEKGEKQKLGSTPQAYPGAFGQGKGFSIHGLNGWSLRN